MEKKSIRIKICTNVHEQKYIHHVIGKSMLFVFKHKRVKKKSNYSIFCLVLKFYFKHALFNHNTIYPYIYHPKLKKKNK